MKVGLDNKYIHLIGFFTTVPQPLTQIARLVVAARGERLTGKLADRLEPAIGMKVVLLNLATEANIANGTRGTVQDIVLDHREEKNNADADGVVRLAYPPAIIKPESPSTIASSFQDRRPAKRLNTPDVPT
jgi:hypothetical protein